MRQTALAVALLAACLAVSVAGAASPPNRVSSPGPVAALGIDLPSVGFASGRSARDCDRVALWNRATGKLTRFARATSCEVTSTGSGIAALSVAGTRAVWLHYTGGNIREWRLYTATPTRPRPRELQFIPRDVDEPAPIVVGDSDFSRFGDFVPYAVGAQVVLLHASGRRVGEWRAPARVTALGGGSGGLAVALADGRVLVFDDVVAPPVGEWNGATPATAAFVTGLGAAVQRGRTLEAWSGGRIRRVTLPAGARVQDAVGTRVAYTVRGRAILLDLTTGATRDVGAGEHVRLSGRTVVVAAGRTVRIVRI